MSNWNINPQAGVDFTSSYTVDADAPEYPGPPFIPGTRMFGTNGSCYLFVRATSTVLTGRVVIVDDNTAWTVRQITNSLARAAFGQMVGVVASTDITTGSSTGILTDSYGWIQVAGYTSDCAFNTGSTEFTQAHTSATGVLMDTTGGAGTTAKVDGIVLLATAADNTAAALLNFPTVGAAD